MNDSKTLDLTQAITTPDEASLELEKALDGGDAGTAWPRSYAAIGKITRPS